MAVQGSQSCHLHGKIERKSATGTLYNCVSSPALPAVCLLVIFVLLYFADVALFGSRSLRETAGSTNLESLHIAQTCSVLPQRRSLQAHTATQTAAAGLSEQEQTVTDSLRLPTGELVPLDDPQDQVEIACKTATLGGHFDYYQKDFADRNVSSSKGN